MKIYRNLDTTHDKFFLSNDNTKLVTDIRELKSCKLNRQVYFSPSRCPLISVGDSELGSCFEGYTIPTESYGFYKTDTGFAAESLNKTLSLDAYVDILHREITAEVTKIYRENSRVIFCYSGGIDSIAVLSYIIATGNLNKTTLVINNNLVSNGPGCLYYDSEQLSLTKELINELGVAADWMDITEQDILTLINYHPVNHLVTYSTSKIFHTYKDCAVIGGWHGNQALLHKYVFWDEIALRRNTAKQEIQEFLDSKKQFYTSSLRGYDINKTLVPIERVHMLQKPWGNLSGINNNKWYAPLANDVVFQSLRMIDFSKVTINTIASATVARTVIHRNVSTMLDKYIVEESLNDGDSTGLLQSVNADKIDPSLLVVPGDLNHNSDGIDWLKTEISKPVIPFNSLVSLKTLQWLDKKLKST